MKINNNTLIIGGAAVLAASYVVYKKTQDKRNSLNTELDIAKKQAETAEAKAKKAAADAASAKANSLQNPNSLKSKIAVIQKSIGVVPDGIIGTQSLKQLKTLFPMLVNLTNANIERIYNFCKANPYTTPNATNVQLDYGKVVLHAPMVIPNNNSGVNVFTNIFKPFK